MSMTQKPNLTFCKVGQNKKPKAVAKNYAVELGRSSSGWGLDLNPSIAFHGVVSTKKWFFILSEYKGTKFSIKVPNVFAEIFKRNFIFIGITRSAKQSRPKKSLQFFYLLFFVGY